jgi:hypothetical protein
MTNRLDDAKTELENAGFDSALMHVEPTTLSYFVPKYDVDKALEFCDLNHHKLAENGIELKDHKIRGGIVITLAIRALNELNIPSGRPTMSYLDKLNKAFFTSVNEEQYHSATSGMNRTNQSTRQRQKFQSNTTHGGVEHQASPAAAAKKKKKKTVSEQINEALEGMATSTGAQPNDLFDSFIASMDTLGSKLELGGSVRDRLTQKGIQFKKSKDNTAIIFYVMNATTGAPQPIARVSAEQLEKPNEFEEILLSILDLSRGDAPGALKQQQELIRAQEQAVRDVAKSAVPQPETEEIV